MATSNIKLFDENKANMLTDSEYNSNTQRQNGVQSGVASSKLNNKIMYQLSLVAYAIGQLMAQNGKDANDADAVSTFVANMDATMVQKVKDIASSDEAKAGVNSSHFMTPYTTKVAIEEFYKKSIKPEVESVKYKVGDTLVTLRDDLDDTWVKANNLPTDNETLINLEKALGIDPYTTAFSNSLFVDYTNNYIYNDILYACKYSIESGHVYVSIYKNGKLINKINIVSTTIILGVTFTSALMVSYLDKANGLFYIIINPYESSYSRCVSRFLKYNISNNTYTIINLEPITGTLYIHGNPVIVESNNRIFASISVANNNSNNTTPYIYEITNGVITYLCNIAVTAIYLVNIIYTDNKYYCFIRTNYNPGAYYTADITSGSTFTKVSSYPTGFYPENSIKLSDGNFLPGSFSFNYSSSTNYSFYTYKISNGNITQSTTYIAKADANYNDSHYPIDLGNDKILCMLTRADSKYLGFCLYDFALGAPLIKDVYYVLTFSGSGANLLVSRNEDFYVANYTKDNSFYVVADYVLAKISDNYNTFIKVKEDSDET